MLQTKDAEYPVDPKDIVNALSQVDVTVLDSGMIPPDVIYVREKGTHRFVASYRPPQITGIWLDGSDEALRVPLPGLVMIRHTMNGRISGHNVVAVQERPTARTKVYVAPLPNVSGNVCWGNVAIPINTSNYNDLSEDWAQFFGTRFGNHSVSRKCKSHEDDVRQLFIDLSERKARKYPTGELIEQYSSFSTAIEGLLR